MGKLIFFVAVCVLLWWLFTRGPLSNHPAAPAPTPTQVAEATTTPAPPPLAATPASLSPAVTPATVLSLVPSAPPRPAAPPATARALAPLRPIFERACKENQVDLIGYDELSPTIVQFTGRSRRPTGVGDVLDTLRRQGVLRDIDLKAVNPRNGKSSWPAVEHDVPVYYSYYKVSVYR
ncbi:MAG: hypothetical protein NTW86_06445 [Candidatus Sumerlaeota bacterium]|nr:hypothetical protein [Candidatus Sumerlaeota bacterium]